MTSRERSPRWQLSGNTGEVWHLWNLTYGANTDSGDAGFIMNRGERGFEAFTRGDAPRSLGLFDSLDGAAGALKSIY